jgi:hypothetical protein
MILVLLEFLWLKFNRKAKLFGYVATEISSNEMINISWTDMWSLDVLIFILFTEYLSYSKHPIEHL